MVEWELDARQAETLLNAFTDRTSASVPEAELRFYCLAYAAFRTGQTALCAAMSDHDPAERVRLRGASARYRADAARLLEATP